MKVVSKLVELDFDVSSIQSSKNGLVVLNDPAVSIPTRVHITPEDAMRTACVVFRSGAAWRFMLTFPFVHLYRKFAPTKKKPRSAK